MTTDKCPICHRTDGLHKMQCPNRPGYADRVVVSMLRDKNSD